MFILVPIFLSNKTGWIPPVQDVVRLDKSAIMLILVPWMGNEDGNVSLLGAMAGKMKLPGLVNVQKTMEYHHF